MLMFSSTALSSPFPLAKANLKKEPATAWGRCAGGVYGVVPPKWLNVDASDAPLLCLNGTIISFILLRQVLI